MSQVIISKDRHTLTVRVPFTLRKCGGRKLVIAPDGSTWAPRRPEIDSTMVKAIARAHRWKRMLESGEYASVKELAAAEKINQSYPSAGSCASPCWHPTSWRRSWMGGSHRSCRLTSC